MAEVKNAFIKSKMNKDLDARLLPNGEYREGINIQVSKSEGADVGALENVLGNIEIADYKTLSGCNCDLTTIGLFSDEINDNIYIFLTDYDETINTSTYEYKVGLLNYSTTANNYLYVYNTKSEISTLLLSGSYLNFSKNKPINNVNLLENILFWTDNRNQPRRIDVTKEPGYYNTEDQISVATYAPFQPINLYYKRDGSFNTNGNRGIVQDAVVPGSSTIVLTSDGFDPNGIDLSGDGYKALVGATITAIDPATGNTVEGIQAGTTLSSYIPTTITLSQVTDAAKPAIPQGTYIYFNQNLLTGNNQYVTSMLDVSSKMNPEGVYDPNFPGTTTNANYNPNYNGDPDFLEDKFVRFSYRFKYDTGEYSIMAPFTQVAFIPKQDGYFLNNTTPTGMTSDEQSTYRSTVVDFMENKVNNIILQIPTPLDISNNPIPANQLFEQLKIQEIEILYKESDALAIRVVDSISWDGTGGYAELGGANNIIPYNYQGTKPYKTLPEGDLTRVYDKAPVRALGQEIIGNRVVYSNFQDKHTPPETLNYNVAISEKYTNFVVDDPTVEAPLYKTSSREYPMHTVKQNRNYQIGVVLSDKFGRSSTTILSSATIQAKDADDLTLLGDTIYFPYNNVSSTDNTLNNINDWAGDSIKVSFNEIIPETAPNLVNGWPGLYNGDVTSTSYNPLGWYSYKIVVKQTEQEYYNVYLPGLMNFYPPVTDDPDVARSVSYITLLNDNINKVPRDLTEVGPEQKQFRSSVRLYGRVAPEYDNLAPDPLYNYQFNPINTATNIALSDTVATISDQNDLFDNTTNIKFGSIYQTASNPSMARVSISQNIGSAEPAAGTTAINTWLSIYETIPTESRIDIYWETSTTGTISELNKAILTVSSITGFTTENNSNPPDSWTFNLYEDIVPGGSPNTSYAGVYPALNTSAPDKPFYPYKEDTSGVKTIVNVSNIEGAVGANDAMPTTQQPGFWVTNANGEDVSNKFKLVKNTNQGSPSVTYYIKINPDIYFYYGLNSLINDTYTFNFIVEDLDGNSSTNPNYGVKTTLTFTERLFNKKPIISNCPSNGVVGLQAGVTTLFTAEAVNGTLDITKKYDDLTWQIAPGLNATSGYGSTIPAANGLPELVITPGPNGTAVITEPTGTLNQAYPITISLTDAGGIGNTYPLPSGSATTYCAITINGNAGYDATVLNEDFMAVKNACINQGSASSVFAWVSQSNTSTWDTSQVFQGGIGFPQNASTINTTAPSNNGVSYKLANNISDCPVSSGFQPFDFRNVNRNANVQTGGTLYGGLSGERQDQASSKDNLSINPGHLSSGTAYIIVDFVLGNYLETTTGSVYQPSCIWLTKLQYRATNTDPWVTATDVEGNEIMFGGTQANNSNISQSNSSSFLQTGVLDNNTQAESDIADIVMNNANKVHAFQCWYTGRSTTNPNEPVVKVIGRKVFAIGRNSAYRDPSTGLAPSNAEDKFGEYRLVVRYPYSDNVNTDLSSSNPVAGNKILPALTLNNLCPGRDNSSIVVSQYTNYQNALDNQQVYLSFGDFYNPVQLYNTYQVIGNVPSINITNNNVNPPSYSYRISEPYDSASEASCQEPNDTVYAREWAFKYVSQLFTDPQLTTAFVPTAGSTKWYSYVGTSDSEINVIWGNQNSNTENGGSPTNIASSVSQAAGQTAGQPANRKWVAQFNSTGKKIMGSAQPCLGHSVINSQTNFRTLSLAQRLSCGTPTGGVQYGLCKPVGGVEMSQSGQTTVFRWFAFSNGVSGQSAADALIGNTAQKNVLTNISTSLNNIKLYSGSSPYALVLDINLQQSPLITKVLWETTASGLDRITLENVTLVTTDFPNSYSNLYWVIT